MKYREKLGYIGLGGFLMLIGMLAAGLFSPLGAHNEVRDAEFGEITCRRIRVVDSDGKYAVVIGDMGYVTVYGDEDSGSATMSVSETGGSFWVTEKDGEIRFAVLEQ